MQENRHAGPCFSRNKRGATVAWGLLAALLASAAVLGYTDTFDGLSFSGQSSFDTGTAEEGLHYHATNVSMDADAGSIHGLADGDDPWKITITPRAGGIVSLNELWIDTQDDVVLSGSGAQPFSVSISAGTVGDEGPSGTKWVTQVVIEAAGGASSFDIRLDNLDVEFADASPPRLTAFVRHAPTDQDTNADTLSFRATFNEDVQYVTADDFDVTGTTADVATVNQVSTDVYELTVTGGDLAGYDGTVGIDLSAGQNIADLSDNALPADEPATDETYELDNTSPSDPAPSSSSHTVSVWDDDETIDIQISGASDTGSGVDGFEVEWNQSGAWTSTETKEQEENWAGATFTSTSDGDWYFHISTVDYAGNWTSTEHLGPFRIDTTPPSAPTGLDPADGTTTTDTSPVLSWIASTDTGGSGIRDSNAYRIVVTGPVNRDTYVSDTDYNPTLSEGTFTWKVYARDRAGNSSAYSVGTTLIIDATQPNVTIERSGGQADPTNVSPVVFTAVFDEPIDDATFTGTDVFVGGTATTGAIIVTEVAPNDDTTFEVSIVLTGDGTVVPSIPAGGVEDFAGNTNTASTSTDNVVAFDGSQPSVTIDQAAGQFDPTNASPVSFRVVFDESINEATFTNADVSVGGTATSGIVTVTEVAPNDDTTFEVSIAVTGDGTVVPSIPAGGVEDPFGNTNSVSTSTDNTVTVDTTGPVVENVGVSDLLISDADAGGALFQVTVSFNEALNAGFVPALVFSPDVVGGADPTLVYDSHQWMSTTHATDVFIGRYTVADQGVDFDSVTIDVIGAQDRFGNAQQNYAPEQEFEIDTQNPTGTIWFDDPLFADADVGSRDYLNLSFSEDMDTLSGDWPTWSFSPNVTTKGGTGTLGHTTPAGWTSATTFRRNYVVFDTNEPYKSVDLQLNTAYDLAGNRIEPSPTIHVDALTVDTESPTVASVTVSHDRVDELDDGKTFTVTVDFTEAMTADGSADPTVTFAPDVATTLAVKTSTWIDGDTWAIVYDVADTNAIDVGVDVRIAGGKDVVGNAQVAYDDPDRFDIDMVSPPPGTVPTILITPAGAAGNGFLDGCLDLEEGEDPPMIGLRPLTAIYEIGQEITGGCLLCDEDGRPLRGTYVHVFVYAVDPHVRPEVLRLSAHWTVHYDSDCGGYSFGWDSSEQLAGYYDVRLAFPDGSAETRRIQLIEPESP